MSEIKVNSIKGVGASAAAITVNNTDGTCTANITNNLSNRNLIINGAMQVAQRGTSNTAGGNGYYTVDRMYYYNQGIDNDVTKAQVDVASGTTPYTLGFRKAFKLTNGNQSSGAGASDMIEFGIKIEAQDVANSGWNYTSASSFITLSFWVKSSVAQVFYGYLKTKDGTNYIYPFSTGSLTADTWTKVTKTISGNSNLQIDNNNEEGLKIIIAPFLGTDLTASSVTLNQWATFASGTRTPDYGSANDDWYLTNDATFEITGVQLEVGSVATDFEHKRFDDELFACQRYYCELFKRQSDESQYSFIGLQAYGTQNLFGTLANFPRKMRSLPTITVVGILKFSDKQGSNVFEYTSGTMGNAVTRETVGTHGVGFGSNRFIQGGFACGFTDTDGSDYIKVDAEL